jgi:hypothetical protein
LRSSYGFSRFLVGLITVGAAVSSLNLRPTSPAAADLVVLHGRIYTVNAQKPGAEALAISRDKIVAVGSDKEISEYRGPRTQIIDAAGKVVLPGFTDSHIHFLEGALTLNEADLNGAHSLVDLKRKLIAYGRERAGLSARAGLTIPSERLLYPLKTLSIRFFRTVPLISSRSIPTPHG